MNLSLPEDVLDQMALEQAHFDAAPQAFFEAWKRDNLCNLYRFIVFCHLESPD